MGVFSQFANGDVQNISVWILRVGRLVLEIVVVWNVLLDVDIQCSQVTQ